MAVVVVRAEFIVSRNYRMPIYQTFQIIEKISYRTSNIKYLKASGLFCLFPPKIFQKFRKFSGNSENSPEIPKILRKFQKFSGNLQNSPKIQKIFRKFRKFSEDSENSQKFLKIRRKFLKKKVFSEAKISYRYRIISNIKAKYGIDIISSRKKAYRSGVLGPQ